MSNRIAELEMETDIQRQHKLHPKSKMGEDAGSCATKSRSDAD